jgi:HD superfamily phosphohydrolase
VVATSYLAAILNAVAPHFLSGPKMLNHNKHKILNDPVYGFITIQHALTFDLLDHPHMQRLRRISQLGLSHLVYPGAVHNRFHHAIGAMHLMQEAISVLRSKGVEINEVESEGACAAILLHDIGHGPFSHALEHSIVTGVNHEDISVLIMNRLNEEMHGALDTAIAIFNDHHPKRFLHQLISSQLDMDRLDYLSRDSFYSGVAEGRVGSERIIKMLSVEDGQLVVEEKGIYSIEKFVMARRLMYWQVYLHRTVLCAEFMLMSALKRAKHVAQTDATLFCTPALHIFLHESLDKARFMADPSILDRFCQLDDSDILCALKAWQHHSDPILSDLSRRIINRDLFQIELRSQAFSKDELDIQLERVAKALNLSAEDASYFVISERIDNRIYESGGINIRFKDGSIQDFGDASDHWNRENLTTLVVKSFLCYPKNLKA